jgi:hypothetical protein
VLLLGPPLRLDCFTEVVILVETGIGPRPLRGLLKADEIFQQPVDEVVRRAPALLGVSLDLRSEPTWEPDRHGDAAGRLSCFGLLLGLHVIVCDAIEHFWQLETRWGVQRGGWPLDAAGDRGVAG